MKEKTALHFIDLSTFYKQHFFEIIYFYTDSIAAKEIINMLNASKFDK